MVNPTEVEIELKKRLDQLTDRLIQKQMQVHSLRGLSRYNASCLFFCFTAHLGILLPVFCISMSLYSGKT